MLKMVTAEPIHTYTVVQFVTGSPMKYKVMGQYTHEVVAKRMCDHYQVSSFTYYRILHVRIDSNTQLFVEWMDQ